MGQVLEALHRMQEIELQLAELRRARDAKVRRVEFHKRKVRDADARILSYETTARQRQIRLDAIQLDVNARDQDLNKHRQALNTAKTNKEYAAILTAMNTEKADNSKFETEILQLMDEVQKLTADAEALKAEKEQFGKDVVAAEKVLAAYDADRKAEHTTLESRKKECAGVLDSQILSTFNRVAEHHEGEAMANVIKLHPKRDDYACSGCNLKITLEVVNSLHTRDELQICKVCGRILYIDLPTKERSGV